MKKKKLSTNEISKRITKVAKDYYSEVKQSFDNVFVESYGGFPNEFIHYQDRLIANIVRSPSDQCLDLSNLSQRAGEYILKSEIKPDKEKLRIYFIKELVNFALEGEQNKHYTSIDKELNSDRKIGLILGYRLLSFYRLLSLLSQHRFHSYIVVIIPTLFIPFYPKYQFK